MVEATQEFTGWVQLWPAIPGIALGEEEVAGSSSLPVIRVYGKTGSGKTLFGIMALARPKGHEYNPTIIWDYELGSQTYAAQYAIEYRDMVSSANDKVTQFAEWANQVKALKAGDHAVAIIDPAEDWEDGLKEYVAANPQRVGYSKDQLFNKYGQPTGLYYGAIKKFMKDMLTMLAGKVQTIVLVNHIRQSYNGNTPIIGKFEPKGSDILNKLATIEAWLMPNAKGIGAPSARIIKSRLNVPDWDNCDEYGTPELRPLLPLYMEEFSAKSLRDYLAHPRKKFTAAEMNPIDPSKLALSDAERLSLEAAIATERVAATKAEAEKALIEAKEHLIANLIGAGQFTDRAEIGKVSSLLKEEGITLESCDMDTNIFADKLVAKKQAMSNGG